MTPGVSSLSRQSFFIHSSQVNPVESPAMHQKKPELLSPAGSLNHMRFAFAYGADAVYAGQPRYSLRVRNNEFSKEDVLGKGIEEAHAMGKLFFLASNIAPHNSKLKTYINDLEPIIEMGPDALIMSDPGLIMMVRERWPDELAAWREDPLYNHAPGGESLRDGLG